MTDAQYAKRTLRSDPLWRAFTTIAAWPIDEGPVGDWARRVQGLLLWQLGDRLETRLRRIVEGTTYAAVGEGSGQAGDGLDPPTVPGRLL